MKRLLIILSIAVLATSCKKEKLYNCLEGKWYNSSGWIDTIIINNGSFSNATGSYNVDKNGNVTKSGVLFGTINCNGNNFTWIYDNYTNVYKKLN